MKVLILLTCVAAALAGFHKCGYRLNEHTHKVAGDWSDQTDDAESLAVCPPSYQLVRCECVTRDGRPTTDCDGSFINPAGDCVAYNSATGHGVHALAYCLEMVITCPYDGGTPYDNQPRTKCPANFYLSGCTMHAHAMHDLWINDDTQRRHPVGTRGGFWTPGHDERITKFGVCGTEHGCSDCKVQARCVRINGFTDRFFPDQ